MGVFVDRVLFSFIIWRCAFLLVCLLCTGCGLTKLADSLNERKVQSCIYTSGFLSPFQIAKTITATGGVTVEQCHEFR